MKPMLIGAGLFIIIFICLIPLQRDIKEYETQKHGQLVTVTITYVPECIGAKVMHFIKFKYEGKKFDKKVGCGFGDNHKVGDSISLKHIEGTDIFLFENEKKETEFISSGLLCLFGIYCIVIGIKRK